MFVIIENIMKSPVFVEEYRAQSSPLRSSLHSPIHQILQDSN